MRCSSCEILLDRYVEGTLPPARMAAVSRHVRTCTSCERLLTELRVVDALLATTKPVELAPNFTFAVMAETHAIAAPRRPARAPWRVLAVYVTAAWLVACAGSLLGLSGTVRSVVAPLFAGAANALAAAAGVAHGLAGTVPAALALSLGVLAVDGGLAILAYTAYRRLRPFVARTDRTEAS